MAVINKPDMSYGIWAQGGNIEIPSSEKVQQGWTVEKPLNETMNWLQNKQDRYLAYLNQQGIPEWDTKTTYAINSYAVRAGVLFQSTSQNIDADPTTNSNIWKRAFVSFEDFQTYSDIIQKMNNEDGYLSFYVKKSDPVLDAPVRGISYYNKTSETGLSFVEETPRIESSGRVVAEFSGGNNPKDVVTHEQLALAIQNYKIGDIYISTVDGDPKTRLGYGSWQRFGRGKTLVGFSDEVSNTIPEWTKVAGTEFGEYKHKLTVDEMPSHSHNSAKIRTDIDLDNGGRDSGVWNDNAPTTSTGGDAPHNNVQPSLVVYFWKRTA